MMTKKLYVQLVLAALVICWTAVPKARADSPKQQLQITIERVLEVIRTIQSEEDIARNKGLLRQILSDRFDFTEMARRSLGSHWDNLNGKEGEFVSAFTQFIESSYFGTLGSYQGERIVYGHEQLNQEFAQVDTQVVGGRGAAIDLQYRLHRVGGEWKVYDVVIDQVSLVSNYRSQFRRVLQTVSLDELLRKLREKGS